MLRGKVWRRGQRPPLNGLVSICMPFALLIQFYAFLFRRVGCKPAGERSFLPVNDFVRPGTAREKRTQRQNERERRLRLGGQPPPAPSTGARRPSWPQLVNDSSNLTARSRSSSQKRWLVSGWKVTGREARLGLPGDGVPSSLPVPFPPFAGGVPCDGLRSVWEGNLERSAGLLALLRFLNLAFRLRGGWPFSRSTPRAGSAARRSVPWLQEGNLTGGGLVHSVDG